MRRDSGASAAIRQTILLTGALSVLPLLPYPNTLGMGLFQVRPFLGFLEALLYLGALSIFAQWLTFSQRISGAVLIVVYRHVLGAACGSLMAISDNQGWGPSLAMAMWSYPPAVLLHVLAAPFVTSALLRVFWGREVRRVRATTYPQAHVSVQPKAEDSRRSGEGRRSLPGAKTQRATALRLPGLDDAIAYVGEYDGVRMCWMVDQDGLPLAVWQRQEYTGSADFWAPISLEIVEFDRRCLSVGGDVRPQRVEVRTDSGRIILETVGDFWLGVLTDRDTDELISLRLTQSRDMILKHLQERRAQYVGLQEARYV